MTGEKNSVFYSTWYHRYRFSPLQKRSKWKTAKNVERFDIDWTKFCVGSNPARDLLEVCDNESRWQWSWLEAGTIVSGSHCRKLPTRREQSLNLRRIEFRLKFFSSSDNHCITVVIAVNLARTCYRSFQKNKYYWYNFDSCWLSCNHLIFRTFLDNVKRNMWCGCIWGKFSVRIVSCFGVDHDNANPDFVF